MADVELPFRPREKLLRYLKGRYDVITFVGIPLALAASSLFLIHLLFTRGWYL